MYFEINKGDKVGIIGWNGAGKLILLKVVFQRLIPKILINGGKKSLWMQPNKIGYNNIQEKHNVEGEKG